MPCVLPVLSLKLMGVLKHGGGHTSYVRFSFIMSALGIITSFLAIAAILVLLQNAGHSVGWGIQFQEPIFLIIIILLLTIFAANEWGLINISLPYWLGGKIDNIVQKQDDHTPIGNFITGAFATILATPCTAPYLGTAISFSLSQGNFAIFLTFFFMGLGLASPYLFFSIFPNLVTKLPKPGQWMIKVKHFFGYLLFATALWFIYVLNSQIGFFSAIILLTIILIIFTIMRIFNFKEKKPFYSYMVLSLFVLSIIIPLQLSQNIVNEIPHDKLWKKFDEKQISKYVNEGSVVFVDVTAEWCLTCKFNKSTTMHSDRIMKILMRDDVVAMIADYTSPDKHIESFLKRNNKYGIPFNIIYGPNAPKGIAQPELLDSDFLIESFKKAGLKDLKD